MKIQIFETMVRIKQSASVTAHIKKCGFACAITSSHFLSSLLVRAEIWCSPYFWSTCRKSSQSTASARPTTRQQLNQLLCDGQKMLCGLRRSQTDLPSAASSARRSSSVSFLGQRINKAPSSCCRSTPRESALSAALRRKQQRHCVEQQYSQVSP